MNIYIPLLALFLSYLPQSYWVEGTVVSVQDADTITVEIKSLFSQRNEVVRLVYIDAPELAQGAIAKKGTHILVNQVLGKYVKIKVVGRGYYKRLLGEVFIGKESMNLFLVKNGYAFLYPWSSFLSNMQKTEYKTARDDAKKRGLGVWSSDIKQPWVFRKKNKKKKTK